MKVVARKRVVRDWAGGSSLYGGGGVDGRRGSGELSAGGHRLAVVRYRAKDCDSRKDSTFEQSPCCESLRVID